MPTNKVENPKTIIFESDVNTLDIGFLGLQKAIEENNDLLERSTRRRDDGDHMSPFGRMSSRTRNRDNAETIGSFSRDQTGFKQAKAVRIENAFSDIIIPLHERLELLGEEQRLQRENFDREHFLWYDRLLDAFNKSFQQQEEVSRGLWVSIAEFRRHPFWASGRLVLNVFKGIATTFQTVGKVLFGFGDQRTELQKIRDINAAQLKFMRTGETTIRRGGLFKFLKEKGIAGTIASPILKRIAQHREDARSEGRKDIGSGLFGAGRWIDSAFGDFIKLPEHQKESNTEISSQTGYLESIDSNIHSIKGIIENREEGQSYGGSIVNDASNDFLVDQLKFAANDITTTLIDVSKPTHSFLKGVKSSSDSNVIQLEDFAKQQEAIEESRMENNEEQMGFMEDIKNNTAQTAREAVRARRMRVLGFLGSMLGSVVGLAKGVLGTIFGIGGVIGGMSLLKVVTSLVFSAAGLKLVSAGIATWLAGSWIEKQVSGLIDRFTDSGSLGGLIYDKLSRTKEDGSQELISDADWGDLNTKEKVIRSLRESLGLFTPMPINRSGEDLSSPETGYGDVNVSEWGRLFAKRAGRGGRQLAGFLNPFSDNPFSSSLQDKQNSLTEQRDIIQNRLDRGIGAHGNIPGRLSEQEADRQEERINAINRELDIIETGRGRLKDIRESINEMNPFNQALSQGESDSSAWERVSSYFGEMMPWSDSGEYEEASRRANEPVVEEIKRLRNSIDRIVDRSMEKPNIPTDDSFDRVLQLNILGE